MVELVTRNHWWPEVTRNVGRYVEGCDLCQQMKNRTEEVAEKLKLEEVLEKPWMHISVDFITKLPVVAGKNTILIVCDRLSKMTHFVATTEGTTVEGLARLFRDNVWSVKFTNGRLSVIHFTFHFYFPLVLFYFIFYF